MIKRFRLGMVAVLGLLVLAACGTPTPPNTTRTLTVNVNGDGTVTSNPAGIDTGAGDTTFAFDVDTEVTLTAVAGTAGNGSEFVGWSGGGCSGTGTCVVTMNADATVTAEFEENEEPPVMVELSVAINVGGAAAGSVVSSPAGIDTGAGENSAEFAVGTEVTLTASATTGGFAAWTGGDCAGVMTLTCVVTIGEGEAGVAANFNDISTATIIITAIAEDSEEFAAASADDGDRWPEGFSRRTSNDLEVGIDPDHAPQYIALRFTSTGVPAGARISSASVALTALDPNPNSGDFSVEVWGEANAAPAELGDDADNTASFDISSRTPTTATATWDVAGAWTPGSQYSTPDLTAILQEIVGLAGFNGNVVLVLGPNTENGNYRRAQPAHTTNGPTLSVEYVVLPPL